MKYIQAGFTLIELMVVVAIIGIISAIAYPSYRNYTCDTYTGQAIADLRVCALALDRYYSDDFTYDGAVLGDLCSTQSPADGTAKFDLAVTLTDANQAYTLNSTVVAGSSCGGPMSLTSGGVLTEE